MRERLIATFESIVLMLICDVVRQTTKRRENEKINVMKKKHTEAVEYLMRSNTQLEKAVKQMDPKNG